MDHGRRRYIVHSKAWWGPHQPPTTLSEEVNFGLASADGGTVAECLMRWHDVRGEISARLEVFGESLAFLLSCQDLLDRLKAADCGKLSPDEFTAILDECGFEDVTPTENPHVGKPGFRF